MAKLENVLAVVSSISVDGVTYVESAESAKVGDIIRYNSAPCSYVSKGGYYSVVRLDSSDDPQIMDDDDDEYDAEDEDFTVYSRQQVVTVEAPSDTVIIGGIEYTKVNRAAVAGERFLVVNASLAFDYGNGDSFIAKSVDSEGGASFTDNINSDNFADRREYVVLEPVVVPAETTDTIVHNGITYNVVKRKVADGDAFIVITDDDGDSYKTVGKVYVIIRIDSDGDPEFIDNDGDEIYARSADYAILEAVKSAEPVRAIIGDQIRITRYQGGADVGTVGIVSVIHSGVDYRVDGGQTWGADHDAYEIISKPAEPARLTVGDYAVIKEGATGDIRSHIGSVTKITKDDGGRTPYQLTKLSGILAGWAYESEVRRATEAEIADATKPPRLKVGRYVIITGNNNGGSAVGDLVKIVADDGSTFTPYSVEHLDGRCGGFKYAHNVRLATEVEVEAALAELQRVAIWTKLGRKVGEFRKGDIVKSGSIIGIIEDNGTSMVGIRKFNGVYEGEQKSDTTLIAPVESRLDIEAAA